MERGVRDGDLVRVLTREGRPVGFGFAHTRSQIALRVLSYDPEQVPDERWLAERVSEAARLREQTLGLPAVTNAWRWLHAEGDGVSGLVADRYADVVVVSLFSLGWWRRVEEVAAVLRAEGARAVVVRADARVAEQEGIDLPPPTTSEEVEIHEHGLRFRVDCAGGHKTGFFLDQRDNRALVARLARGRRVFDGMTYTGGFALAAARGGAATVEGVDLDERAIEQAREHAVLNGLEARFRHGDVFDALRALAAGDPDERPDLLVVDPAKWARDRRGLGAALARYGDLNRLALEAVRPGGLVFSHSCSGLVGEETFLGVLRDAALDVRRAVRFLYVGGAAADHPVAAAFPEGRYLKSVLLEVGGPESGPGRARDAEGGAALSAPRSGPRAARSASASRHRRPSGSP
jgi:23S rRNA (cytosine1962-C5)-methyltransferase